MNARKTKQLSVFIAYATMAVLALVWIHSSSQAYPVQGKTLPIDEAIGAELIRIVNKQSDAWNRGDMADFMAAYWKDERLTFSSSGKTQRGWQATFENYKKNYPDRETMGKLTFSDFETQELGTDALLMLGRWHLQRAEPVGGNFSLVWKRIESKWVIVHDHSSSLKKED